MTSESDSPRTLVVGDIHGCYRALINLAQFVPFRDDDLIITLGDYVDRGPNSKSVVDWVIERTQAGTCIPLKGNHEVMMLAAVDGQMPLQQWLIYGGKEALQSYSLDGLGGTLEDIEQDHLRFMREDLHRYHETDTHLFAHAGMLANIPPEEQADYDLFWERFDLMAPHKSGKTVVCGHTAQKTGSPANRGHAICIDTWVYGRGWLTCLDVNTGEFWQTDQQGNRRANRL